MSQPPEHIHIPESEYVWEAVRASGPGGQHVNKVASAVHLRFDIHKSSLPLHVKERLLNMSDKRITQQGEILIKAGMHRSQHKNLEEALNRLKRLIARAATPPKKRKATRPPRKAIEKRLKYKARRKEIKKNRGKVDW